MAFLWRADDGPTLNSGLVALRFFRRSGPGVSAVLLYETLNFCDFSGGSGSGPPSPPLDPPMPQACFYACGTDSKMSTSGSHNIYVLMHLNNSPVVE